ncbi:alpha/beta hydrolase [Streptomyces varsoviensis]|nr:alpha/beta hydrolase [Streptomyces varsoviensis]
MTSSRLLRTSGTAAVVAAALLISGCAAGSSAFQHSKDVGYARDEAAPPQSLQPLPASPPAALKPYYGQRLTWHACRARGFECATMKVPLDYARPDAGEDVKLAVARKKATGSGAGDAGTAGATGGARAAGTAGATGAAGDSTKRIGSLLVNPGGPGGSAIGYLQQYAGIGYPAAVRARYDMVAVDPRGVAASEPVTCLSNRQMDEFTATDQTPDDEAEVGRLVAAYKKFGRGCASRSGRILGHVSTIEAARDMDVLRAVLGDGKLNYVGASYGTLLGATYAGLYPSRVGRVVLDGAMDPSLDAKRMNREQTAGFETAFTSFAKDCVGRKDCPLGTKNPADAGRRLKALFNRIDQHPLRTPGPRRLTESLATTGVIAVMYDQSGWPQLRTALKSARKGDGSALLALSDRYYERNSKGGYQNLMYANPAVNCLDLPAAFHGPADVREAVPAFEKASPVFGRGLAWSALNCAYWPRPATGRPHRIEAKGAAPIVVVGTTRDPATPYRWARGLAAQLTSGRLLTYNGDGHTAYGRGSACIDTAINTYLLKATPPTPHKTCT